MDLNQLLEMLVAGAPLSAIIVYMLWRIERSQDRLHADVMQVIKHLAGINGGGNAN